MTHPHVETLRSMDEAIARGDLETMFAAFTDDVVVHMGGDNRLTGDYRGLDALKQFFGRFMDASGEYSFETHDSRGSDEHGVILQRGTMKRGDKRFSTAETFVYHFRDEKISEFWSQPVDQPGIDAWWGK